MVNDEIKDEKFTRANVLKSTNKAINMAAAEEGLFVYQFIDKLMREKYPQYFRERRRKLSV